MIWGAPNFCPKNDLMHCVLHKKSIDFSVQIKRCSPKKKVFTEIETVFRHWCAHIKQLFARIFDVLNQMGGGDRPPSPLLLQLCLRLFFVLEWAKK